MADSDDARSSLVVMPTPTGPDDPEDAKLVTLSRATRQRTGAAEGAAVRDLDGRTYTAAAVELPSLRLSGLALAVAMAVSSGAKGLEAAAVVTDATGPETVDLAAVRDLAGVDVPVYVADPAGSLRQVVRT
jgi:hypothetical protein